MSHPYDGVAAGFSKCAMKLFDFLDSMIIQTITSGDESSNLLSLSVTPGETTLSNHQIQVPGADQVYA